MKCVIIHNQIKTVPVDLSKLKNVVNNDVVKKTIFGELIKQKSILLFTEKKMKRMEKASENPLQLK